MQLVYVLSDPRTGAVRYVGVTGVRSPLDRLRSHIAEALRGGTSARCDWIRSVLDDGLEPTITVVDRTEGDRREARPVVLQRETAWIEHFRRIGAALLNVKKSGADWRVPMTTVDDAEVSRAWRRRCELSATHK